MPRVSIVVPVHNRSALLPATLDSVHAQTFTDWECIVVDDHSTDDTVVVAREYAQDDPRFRVVELPHPGRYVSAARNYGLSLARGEFINFLDSDDLFTRHKLADQLEHFDQNPTVDVVTARHIVFNGKVKNVSQQMKFSPKSQWLDVLWFAGYGRKYGGLWASPSPLWRSEAIRRIGGWNENIRVFTDPELNLRALVGGLQINRLERILVFVRFGHSSQTSTQHFLKRSPHLHKGVLSAWRTLELAEQVTETRRLMCSFRIFDTAGQYIDGHHVRKALKLWFEDNWTIGMKSPRVLLGGAIVLLVRRQHRWLAKRMALPIFDHFDYLEAALPDVDHIPLDQVSSS